MKKTLLFVLALAVIPVAVDAQNPSAVAGARPEQTPSLQALEAMDTAYAAVDGFTMELKKKELIRHPRRRRPRSRLRRGGDQYHTESGEVRFRKRRDEQGGDYLRDLYYDAGCIFGCPVRYREGIDVEINVNNRLLFKAPMPRSSRAMKDQHHEITALDLGNTIQLVLANVRKGRDRNEIEWSTPVPEMIDGHETLKIEVTLAQEEARVHRVREGETLWDIADEYEQNMYVILYNNPGLFEPTDVREGQTINVPEYYGCRLVIWIDVVRSLPLKLEVYACDEKLYESYEYTELDTSRVPEAANFEGN